MKPLPAAPILQTRSPSRMSINLKVERVIGDRTAPLAQRVISVQGKAGPSLFWTHTQAQVIEHMEKQRFQYYLLKDNQAITLQIAITPEGEKYLTINTPEGLEVLLVSASNPD